MRVFVFIFLITGFSWGNPLRDQLFKELKETAQTQFSDVEIALIASGVEDAETLQAYVEKYRVLSERLKLSDKQLKGNPRKVARTVHKKIFSNLKRENESVFGLIPMLDSGEYSKLTATWLYVAASIDAGLVPSAYGAFQDDLEPYFLNNESMGLRDIAASFLTAESSDFGEKEPQKAWRSLQLSCLLSPVNEQGKGFYDVKLYNMALKMFNANSFEPAGWVAAGAAQRYPSLAEFEGLCYNIGIKLFHGALEKDNWDEAIQLGELLAPFTGQYKQRFDSTLKTVHFNYAVSLYNSGNSEGALAQLELASPSQDGYSDLLTSSLDRVIEKAIEENDPETVSQLLPRLEEANPVRAEKVKTRLSQLKLRDLDASGKLEEALALAREDTTSELGLKNYLAVLTRSSQSKRHEGLDAALALLDSVPDELKQNEVVKTLRFNAYAAELNKYEDNQYEITIPLYKRLFADKGLTLSEEDRKVFWESYGNALYFEVQKLIEDRHFQKADVKSKEALKLITDHKALLDQRKLVDTIMKRISE